jgi:hypothetical protein
MGAETIVLFIGLPSINRLPDPLRFSSPWILPVMTLEWWIAVVVSTEPRMKPVKEKAT